MWIALRFSGSEWAVAWGVGDALFVRQSDARISSTSERYPSRGLRWVRTHGNKKFEPTEDDWEICNNVVKFRTLIFSLIFNCERIDNGYSMCL
jgi:hypothetical protein